MFSYDHFALPDYSFGGQLPSISPTSHLGNFSSMAGDYLSRNSGTPSMNLGPDLALLGLDNQTFDELIKYNPAALQSQNPGGMGHLGKRDEMDPLFFPLDSGFPPSKRPKIEEVLSIPLDSGNTSEMRENECENERLLADLFMYGCGLIAVGFESQSVLSAVSSAVPQGNETVSFEKKYNTMCIPIRRNSTSPEIGLAPHVWNNTHIISQEELNKYSGIKFNPAVSHVDDLLAENNRDFGGNYPCVPGIDSRVEQLHSSREWTVVHNRINNGKGSNMTQTSFVPIGEVNIDQIHGRSSPKIAIPDPVCLLNMLEQSTVLGTEDPFRLCLVLGSQVVMENLARYARHSQVDFPSHYQNYSSRIVQLFDDLDVRYTKCSDEQRDLRYFLNLHSSKSTSDQLYWIYPDDARRVLLMITTALIDRNFSLPRSQCCPRMAFDLHLIPSTCQVYQKPLADLLHLAENGASWSRLSKDVKKFSGRLGSSLRSGVNLDLILFQLSCIFSTRKCISEQNVPVINGKPLSGPELHMLNRVKSNTRPQLENILHITDRVQSVTNKMAGYLDQFSSRAEDLCERHVQTSKNGDDTKRELTELINRSISNISAQMEQSFAVLKWYIGGAPPQSEDQLLLQQQQHNFIVQPAAGSSVTTANQKKPPRKRNTPQSKPTEGGRHVPDAQQKPPGKRGPGRPLGSKNKRRDIKPDPVKVEHSGTTPMEEKKNETPIDYNQYNAREFDRMINEVIGGDSDITWEDANSHINLVPTKRELSNTSPDILVPKYHSLDSQYPLLYGHPASLPRYKSISGHL